MTQTKTKLIGRIRLFEELLGLKATETQNKVASQVDTSQMVAVLMDSGEERTNLIAALTLWYGYLGRTQDVVVYTENEERAREITAVVRRINASVPRSWNRPSHRTGVRDDYFAHFAGAGSLTTGKIRDHISLWHDVVIIDGADRIEPGQTTSEAIRFAREKAPNVRVLVLGQTSSGMMEPILGSGLFTVISAVEPGQRCDPAQ